MPHAPVIELVGPAGVGKSTIWQLLAQRSGVTCASVWELPLPLLLASSGRTIPAIAGLLRAARGWPSEEVQQLIRLGALELFLRRTNGARAVVLDEGPVFAMSWFRVVGHNVFRGDRLAQWWQRTLSLWARRLDVIVLFDAADPLLVRRLRTRAKPHPFRQRPDHDIYEFNAAYRRAFDWIAPALAERGGPRVVCINTDAATPEEIADRVLATCRETVGAR